MAVYLSGLFDKEDGIKPEVSIERSKEIVNTSRLLVVGAGGIGCELLKNLVLTGFQELHVIDLDTIELSNLNRQFLFHKQHIGKPKAVIAKESVLKYNSNANITAYHDSITNTKYDVDFFQQFVAVANALDNVGARTHVNRMCMAAGIPLIESGSSGYIGQVTVHKKGESECYECLPRKPAKTYPGCTIRNTPSEPVHCVVWSKHLFNQLFGESDADDEVSPDLADPELGANEAGNVVRVSTRQWAKECEYDAKKIFQKLFSDDIKYLNEMHDLWKRRLRPKALNWDELPDAVPGGSQQQDAKIKDQMKWSTKQCGEIFCTSLAGLKQRADAEGPDSILTWDKDDDICMDFVASVANLRAFCFHIKVLTRFDLKSIAGNIVPAIATTNAVIAGLIVLQIFKVLKGDISKCKTAFQNAKAEGGRKLISNARLEKPNDTCFVCANTTPEVYVKLNIHSLNIRTLDEKILKEKLHMVQPDIMFGGCVLLSSDPEDNSDGIFERTLSSFDVHSQSKLLCEDFFQQYKIYLNIISSPDLKDQEFEIETDLKNLFEKKENDNKDTSSVEGKKPSQAVIENNTDEDMYVLSEEEVEMADTKHLDMDISAVSNKKKSIESENGIEPPTKKAKTTVE